MSIAGAKTKLFQESRHRDQRHEDAEAPDYGGRVKVTLKLTKHFGPYIDSPKKTANIHIQRTANNFVNDNIQKI